MLAAARQRTYCQLESVSARSASSTQGSGSMSSGSNSGLMEKMWKKVEKLGAAAKAGIEFKSSPKHLPSDGSGTCIVLDDRVEELVGMGFERAAAVQALTNVGGEDIARALELLLSGNLRNEGSLPSAELQPFASAMRFDESNTSNEISSSGSIKARMRSLWQGAKEKLLSMKHRTESVLCNNVNESKVGSPSRSMPNISIPESWPTGMAPLGSRQGTVDQRRDAAEAAEQRLVSARERNAGTMEDWRRSNAAARGRAATAPAANPPMVDKDTSVRLVSAMTADTAVPSVGTGTAVVADEEDEALQIALAASISLVTHEEEMRRNRGALAVAASEDVGIERAEAAGGACPADVHEGESSFPEALCQNQALGELSHEQDLLDDEMLWHALDASLADNDCSKNKT